MKAKISLITLGVDDLARAQRFYRDGLGLPEHQFDAEHADKAAAHEEAVAKLALAAKQAKEGYVWMVEVASSARKHC